MSEIPIKSLLAACRTDAERHAVACHAGRLAAGLPAIIREEPMLGLPALHLPPLPRQGEPVTLRQHAFKIVCDTVTKLKGKQRAAKQLEITRPTLDDILRREGKKMALRSKKVIQFKAAMLILVLAVAGCHQPSATLNPKVRALAPPPMPPQVERMEIRQSLIAPPQGPTLNVVSWSYPPNRITGVMFEIASRRTLGEGWSIKGLAIQTNAAIFPIIGGSEFFTISRVIDVENTNNFIKLKGF